MQKIGGCLIRAINKLHRMSSQSFTSSQKAYHKISGLYNNAEKINFETNKIACRRARGLVFGDRTYEKLDPEERNLVDRYQDWLITIDPNLLVPNTELGRSAFPGPISYRNKSSLISKNKKDQ